MRKYSQIFLIAVFLIITMVIGVMSIICSNNSFSLAENRTLTDAPILSKDSLTSGSYFADWESYFADHIICRDSMLKTFVYIEKSILTRIAVNDVVLDDDILLPLITPTYKNWDFSEKAEHSSLDLQSLQRHIEDNGGNFLFVGIPEQYSMLRDRYAEYIYNDEAWLQEVEYRFFSALASKSVNYLNMHEVFLRDQDYEMYYDKSDHHYNLFGAYQTYVSIRDILLGMGYDINVIDYENINFFDLENPFFGSRGRKIYNLAGNADKLIYYTLATPIEFDRFDNGIAVASEVFDLPEDDDSPVAYSLYMSGDIAETIIQTNRPELPKALIFGDSFTNALETILYTCFDEMRSLDLRYYHEMGLYEYIENYQPDIVICVRDDTVYMLREGNGLFN